jgi:hypothetical protein
MPKPVCKPSQPELVKMPAAPPSMRDYLRGRLPAKELLNVIDVALACDVCVSKVYLWIDEKMVQAVDIGTTQKPYWKIYRPSVIKLIDQLTAELQEQPKK